MNVAHDGKNILIEDLDPRAEIIVGQRKPLGMMEGFHGADVVFFVGYHARAGVEGVLSHTYNVPTTVVEVHLNDGPCSEARMNAGLAGTEDIPIGLVTGDDVTCEEARSLYSGVETAQVKTAIGRYTARCLVPKVAQQRIREAAESAVRGVGEMEPYVLEPPYTLRSSSPRRTSRPAPCGFQRQNASGIGASPGRTETTVRRTGCYSA